MKCSKNFPKVSPENFRKARGSLKIDLSKKIIGPIQFNNNLKISNYQLKGGFKMKYKINGFYFEEGEQSFFYLQDENEKYQIKFDELKINVLVKDSYYGYLNAFYFDRKTKEPNWYLEHCCGASGFGMDIEDKCYGCNPGKTMDPKIGRFHSKLRFDSFEGKIQEKIEGIVEKVEKGMNNLFSDLEKEI